MNMPLSTSPREAQLAAAKQSLCEQAERAVLLTDADMEAATDLQKWIKTTMKKAEDDRTAITGPLNQSLKEINARYRLLTEPLKAAASALAGKMTRFLKVKEDEARAAAAAERKRLDEAALAQAEQLAAGGDAQAADNALADAIAAPAVMRRAAPARGDFGGVSFMRDHWSYAVTDIKALAAAHPELVADNSVAIHKLIRRADNPVREIPGLRIFNDRKVAVR